MPETAVRLYREEDGSVPFLDWLSTIPPKAQNKCLAFLERLQTFGHELRRPAADFLRDGVYELRVTLDRNYRVLYFFHEQTAVISHGVVKERRVPPAEIDRALVRKANYALFPDRHTATEA